MTLMVQPQSEHLATIRSGLSALTRLSLRREQLDTMESVTFPLPPKPRENAELVAQDLIQHATGLQDLDLGHFSIQHVPISKFAYPFLHGPFSSLQVWSLFAQVGLA